MKITVNELAEKQQINKTQANGFLKTLESLGMASVTKAEKQPLRKHEDVCVFYTKQGTYNPQLSTGHRPVNSYTKNTGDGETMGATKLGIKGGGSTNRYPTSVLEFSVVNQDGSSDGGKFHPTQKPVSLMEYLIKTYSNEGETVLDFTMGSGTTGVAALNTGRKFIGIELDDKYFDIAKQRIEEVANRPSVLDFIDDE